MKAEFGSLEDWGLQAIVGGSTGYNCKTSTAICSSIDRPNSCYGLLDIQKNNYHDPFSSSPGLFETATMLTDELQELYKPFYSISHTPPAQNSPAGPTTPSISTSVCKEMKEEPDQEVEEKLTNTDQHPPATAASTYMPKYKRRLDALFIPRKNQHKRIVLQVTSKDLSSDMWAWRKYGQKPIKGSPYPRSYYRCSSSKGCLARKQVEQSCTDSSLFIITYTAEHNHSQPTRKNALAGTVRHKFSTPKCHTRSNSKAAKKGDGGRCSSSPRLALSPETPFRAEEEEEFQGRNIEIETKDENDGQTVDALSHTNEIFFPEFMFDDDFFSGLGDLNGFLPKLGDGHCSTGAVSCESELL